MEVIPASSCEPSFSARLVERVKTFDPRPKSQSFASEMDSSSLFVLTMASTGPKTSSRAIRIVRDARDHCRRVELTTLGAQFDLTTDVDGRTTCDGVVDERLHVLRLLWHAHRPTIHGRAQRPSLT